MIIVPNEKRIDRMIRIQNDNRNKNDTIIVSNRNNESKAFEMENNITPSLRTSILSMIPFTNDNIKAKEAERELSDLVALENEKNKVKNFQERLKQGEHEAVLNEIMKETDMDFHYFNRLKYESMKEANEMGHTINDTETPLPKKTNIAIHIPSETDLQKMSVLIKDEYIHSWEKLQKDLRVVVERYDTQTINPKKTIYCRWKGSDENGCPMTCTNFSLIHPRKTQTNVYGRIIPKRLPFCSYHVKYCVDIDAYHEKYPTLIRNKNRLSLCNECYVQKMHQSPSLLSNYIPGLRKISKNPINNIACRRVPEEYKMLKY